VSHSSLPALGSQKLTDSSACDDKVVTGASDGIGREFAIQLAQAGFNVLLAARNQAKLDAVVDDIGAPFC